MARRIAPVVLLLCVACSPNYLPPENLITQPDELIEGLSAHSGQESPYIAEARIEYYGEGVARKGKLFVMAAPPASVRLEVNSFTDDLISLLVVTTKGFTYFERGKKDCLTGPLCAAPAVSGVPMTHDPEGLIRLLLGDVPLLEDPESRTVEFSTKKGVYVLTLKKGDTIQVLEVAPNGQTIRSARIEKGGKRLFQLTMSGSIRVGDRRFPKRLRLVGQNGEIDLSIDIRELELDVPFSGDPFAFDCPSGTVPRQLHCP